MFKKIRDFCLEHPFYLILIVGLLVYGYSLGNGFVWDDEEQVVNNLAIRSLTNIPYFFSQSTFSTGGGATMSGMYFKPLMTVFFSFGYLLSGPQAWGYHLIQVVLHIVNSYLIFRVFRNFVTRELALIGALLFLVHPGNVESVAYISALQEVLFMFFGLLSILIVMKGNLDPRRWVLLGICLFLAALGKETGLLFWIGVLGYFSLFKRQLIVPYLRLLALLVGLYFVLRYGMAGVGLGHNKLSPIMLASFEERLLSLPKIVFYYLRLLVFPLQLAISQHWVVREANWRDFFGPLLGTVVFVIGWLIVLVKQVTSNSFRPLLFFTGLFIISLGLHSQLVPLDLTVTERWLYLPLFAYLGFVLIFISQLKPRGWVYGLLILIAVIWAGRTFIRTLDWKDGLTLFVKDEPYARGNFDFENNLGVYLYLDGQPTRAAKHYRRSTEIAPHWWTNWNNLGVALLEQGKVKQAETAYLRSMKNGDYYMAYVNYASLLLNQKRYSKLRSFLEEEALPRFPYNASLQQIYQYLENVD